MANVLRFETKRLLLRPYEPGDAAEVWRVIRKPEIYVTTAFIPKNYPRPRADWWIRYVNTAIRNRTGYEIGIFDRATGQYIGNIGLVNVRKEMKSASVAYHIDPDWWERGIATEACERMIQFGFETLHLERISGTCMVMNPASRRVMEHLGFVFEGIARRELLKDGKFYDIAHLSLLQDEWQARKNTYIANG